MLPIRKILYICFLALTIFSILYTSYTMYLVFETTGVGRSLVASISDIGIKEDGSGAYFLIELINPSNIRLDLYNYEVTARLDGTPIATKQSYKYQPLQLHGNTATNLNITISFNNQISHSNGPWSLDLQLMLRTPLPGARIVFSTSLEE